MHSRNTINKWKTKNKTALKLLSTVYNGVGRQDQFVQLETEIVVLQYEEKLYQ